MSTLTVGDLLLQKKNNCCLYLKEIIEKPEVIEKLTEEQIKTYNENTKKIEDAPIFAFIFFVHHELIPNKDNLNDYCNTFLKRNGIEDLEPFEEYKEKIVRYLKLFIDILEYSENKDE